MEVWCVEIIQSKAAYLYRTGTRVAISSKTIGTESFQFGFKCPRRRLSTGRRGEQNFCSVGRQSVQNFSSTGRQGVQSFCSTGRQGVQNFCTLGPLNPAESLQHETPYHAEFRSIGRQTLHNFCITVRNTMSNKIEKKTHLKIFRVKIKDSIVPFFNVQSIMCTLTRFNDQRS